MLVRGIMQEFPALMCLLRTYKYIYNKLSTQSAARHELYSEKIRCKATNLEAFFCMH